MAISDFISAEDLRKMRFIGVTGTNGKSTVALMTAHILKKAGIPCGLIGTLYNDCGEGPVPASYTTPPPNLLGPLLARMKQNGIQAVVMEVSSHALAQNRVEGIDFEIGIFTNLSRDHLDYHQTPEAYAAAKARLFAVCGKSLINARDSAALQMAWASRGEVFFFSDEKNADFYWQSPSCSPGGNTAFQLTGTDFSFPVSIALPGEFNVENAAAALSAARLFGVSPAVLEHALDSFPPVRGRMERVETNRDYDIYIDFAHTPDALSKVLGALRPLCRGRLLVLFGCGGDRDRGKRPEMGRIASEKADFVILTSDNPRTENPDTILSDIAAGIIKDNYTVEPDRKKAIAKALSLAGKGDILLLAGKGHETTVQDKTGVHPFDERTVIREIWKEEEEKNGFGV